MNEQELRPDDEDVGLEPLGRYRGGLGIGGTMRAVLDVLYEADEPLDVDAIAERTFDRVDATARYHARRAYVRQLESRRRTDRRARGGSVPESGAVGRAREPDMPLAKAWRGHLVKLLAMATYRDVLLRDDEGRYSPNPLKPPRVLEPDGKARPYTRERALSLGAEEQAIGDVSAMRTEIERLLRGLDHDERALLLTLAAETFAPGHGQRGARRRLRARFRWLLGRPTTDAGRSWLLAELVRRAYGEPPNPS